MAIFVNQNLWLEHLRLDTTYEDGCLYLEVDTNKTTVARNSIFCENRGAQMVVLDKKSKWTDYSLRIVPISDG